MAKNKDYRPEDIAFPDQVIVESELVKEMKDSYIDYAVSVIVGRPCPMCGTDSSPCTGGFYTPCMKAV